MTDKTVQRVCQSSWSVSQRRNALLKPNLSRFRAFAVFSRKLIHCLASQTYPKYRQRRIFCCANKFSNNWQNGPYFLKQAFLYSHFHCCATILKRRSNKITLPKQESPFQNTEDPRTVHHRPLPLGCSWNLNCLLCSLYFNLRQKLIFEVLEYLSLTFKCPVIPF